MNFIKNPSLNDSYIITSEIDQHISIPGRYDGPISEIPRADLVEGMIQRKSNLVALKQQQPKGAAPSPSNTPAGNTQGKDDKK